MLNTAPARLAVTSSRPSYADLLEEAWQQHLAEKAADAPTVISLFAGCGGSSLGYSMAGFRELLAVEWDDNAVETFRLNFPGVDVWHGDIAKLSVEEVLERTELQPGELDVLDGSPPCQGFSTAGKRDFGDARNQLFKEYVRLLRGLRPRCFIMENVSGMVKGKMKLIFAECLRELKGAGYKVSARLMNAMYFDVPQSRERMIFVGVREDLGVEPSHPRGLARSYTVRDAIGQMSMIEEHRIISARVADACAFASPGWYPGGGKHGMGRALKKTSGRMSSGLSLAWLAWDRPSYTLVKSEIADSGTIHPDGQRYIHPQEAQRIGSYPDGFMFAGKRASILERIGNSVPPLFMMSVANHIRTNILRPS